MKNSLSLRQALAFAAARSALLCKAPETAAAKNLAGLDAVFTEALGFADDVAYLKKMGTLMERARNKDPEAATELNALRSTTIELFVRATSNFATLFFNQVTLQPNEQAVYIHSFRNEVNVRYIGQDGDSRQVKAVKAQKQVFIDMRELTTDEVVYPIRDINLGPDVNAAAKATVDLAFDMANKVDVLAKTLLDTTYGVFTTTGASLSRTWIPNSRIVSSNLPSTNILTLDDNSGTTKFRLKVIRAILKYCNQWGGIWNTPLRPTGQILVPSLEVTDLADEILPTGNTFNAVAQGVLANYMQFDYMGTTWTLIPDVTLAAGTCYPVLNQAVGDLYTKPSMDEEIVESDRRKNIETRVQKKVLNLAAPEPYRVHTVKVVYHS